MEEGVEARYLVLIGWWTVFFPWDWEVCYRTRLRSGQAACYSVPDGHSFFGGLVHEVWSAGWLRLAPFSSNISRGAVRDPPQGPTGDVRQHDFPVCPSVDSVADGGGGVPRGRGPGLII